MNTEWKPGDVAMDPEHGVALVMSATFGGCPELHKACGLHIHYGNGDWNTLVDRLRPLVVIDPEDREKVERLRDALWRGGPIEAWEQGLREFANPKPPKPEEPTGLGAVVEDEKGDRWTRTRSQDHGLNWRAEWGGVWREFADIDIVRVLSEGVQP